MNVKELTLNAIKEISENPETTIPVLVQVLSIDQKRLRAKGNSEKYKAIVNDGFFSKKVILVNPNSTLVKCKTHPKIQIKSWTTEGSSIFIKQSEIIDLDFTDQIGNPISYDEYEIKKYQNPNGDNQSLIEQSNKSKKTTGKIAIKHRQNIIQQQFNFDEKQFTVLFIRQTIQQAKQLEDFEKCGILVVVYDIAPLYREDLWKGGNEVRRTYKVFDETGWVNVTFWGEQAQRSVFQAKQIIAISQLIVKSYNQNKYLEQTRNTQVETRVVELSKILGYNELYEQFKMGNT